VRPPVLDLFRDPAVVTDWDVAKWSDTLPRLGQCGLAGHAAALISSAGVPEDILPPAVRRQFASASLSSAAELQSLRWEMGEVAIALRGSGVKVVPLKGADYSLRSARPALGRNVADLDVLIAAEDLAVVRPRLQAAGWVDSNLPMRPGDVHLPTLIHGLRTTQLEVHTGMVGEGGAVALDVSALLAEAKPVGDGTFAQLSSRDTVLISVAHFIRNKRPFSAFRDLLDLHELVDDFSRADPGFAGSLAERAVDVGLGRALSRAIRDSTELFGAFASSEIMDWASTHRPTAALASALVLVPDGANGVTFPTRMGRVGRMFAALRATRTRGRTIWAAWSLVSEGAVDD
jgi:hypothetical protein